MDFPIETSMFQLPQVLLHLEGGSCAGGLVMSRLVGMNDTLVNIQKAIENGHRNREFSH